MKTLVLCFISFLLLSKAFCQKGLPAAQLVEAAIIDAGNEKKNIFIIATATWCPPCQALKQILHDEIIQPIVESKYHFVYLYAAERGNKMKNNNPGTLDLLVQYDGNTKAVPYWFIIDTAGKKLADSFNKDGSKEYISYPDSKEQLKDFMNILKHTSDFTNVEIDLIKKRLEDLIEF
jgi:thiol-disulfide isomerase/thioredoxin